MIQQQIISEVLRLAPEYGLTRPSCALAFFHVETKGSGVESDGSPVFLCEPHCFWERSPKADRARAVKAGVASAAWSRKDYATQGTLAGRKGLFAKMAAFDRDRAFESISMGLSQIMGWHADELGYANAEAMWTAFSSNESEQVEATFKLLKKMGLIDAMNRADYAAMAKAWNGSQYRVNAYDKKLAAADATLAVALRTGQTTAPPEGVLAIGSKGTAVSDLQRALSRWDPQHTLVADGKFGPAVFAAVETFQTSAGMPVSGRYDEATRARLADADPLPNPRATTITTSVLKQRRGTVFEAMRARVAVWGGGLGLAGGNAMVTKFASVDGVSDLADRAQRYRDVYGKVHDLLGDTPATIAAWAWTHPPVVATGVGVVALAGVVGAILTRVQCTALVAAQTGLQT